MTGKRNIPSPGARVGAILLSVWTLFSFCGPPGAEAETRAPAGRRLFSELKPDRELVAYGGVDLKALRFAALKKDEGRELAASLRGRYGLRFKIRTTKYFNIAYRGSDARWNRLRKYSGVFFREIYPRYFRYEPGGAFRVVYFADSREFRKKTGMDTYGYYSPVDRALYTYMGSGHGTLWHEMIHAFVAANLDAEPQQWFSEGFASFYEMAFLRGRGVSEGYANWRLPALQRNIRSGKILPLGRALLSDSFQPGFDYPEARFLFCWLWTRRALVPFVRAYLFELAPRYRGAELGRRAIRKMEKLTGRDVASIDSEYRALALRVRKNQKLSRASRGTPEN